MSVSVVSRSVFSIVIQDPSHATTAADDLLQEMASAVTRISTGSRVGPELIRRPRRESPSSFCILCIDAFYIFAK